MSDLDNPMAHELILSINRDAHVLRAVTESLEHRKVPLVLLHDLSIGWGDPVAAYVHEHYHCESGICVREGLRSSAPMPERRGS